MKWDGLNVHYFIVLPEAVFMCNERTLRTMVCTTD
jgi:hypothetical protein